MRFRQIHLDFHTSPHIPKIGSKFDKKQWQEALQTGYVNSINLFAKCHHGWSYHPTEVGKTHPGLDFDLLGEQIEACREIDVRTPVYISAGVDNVAAQDHPEWREVGGDGRYLGWTAPILSPGFRSMCFNGPYMDYLCAQIEEVVRLFPDIHGLWLDIIHQGECCCPYCLHVMEEHGLDPERSVDRQTCAQMALERYYRRAVAAGRSVRSDMPVFHNSGHIPRGNREILKYFSHLELESLPTGGWGYDHFPLSALYVQTLPYEAIGMTGKFHTTWGEFGGIKHPNALKYECGAMLAYGVKCCVGDQLHPGGVMDPTTYHLIGAAYAEVEAKEAWCDGAKTVSDIGLLSAEAMKTGFHLSRGGDDPDVGAARVFMEEHLLFDVLDREADFNKYRMLVLPDVIRIDEGLRKKLEDYLDGGGNLFLTGESGLAPDGAEFALDIGAKNEGLSEFSPDYVLPVQQLRPNWVDSPLVMYTKSRRIQVTSGESLGDVYDPYFNRSFRHFCSHQHAPALSEPSGYHCGVRKENVLYLAHPVFTLYHGMGAVAYRSYIGACLRLLLGDPTLETNLPSDARVSLMDQPAQNRYVLHLLYAPKLSRGGKISLGEGASRGGMNVEVIEELPPARDTRLALRLEGEIREVEFVPQREGIDFSSSPGEVAFTVPEFRCHQMVALQRKG